MLGKNSPPTYYLVLRYFKNIFEQCYIVKYFLVFLMNNYNIYQLLPSTIQKTGVINIITYLTESRYKLTKK